ncbi:helix-turn-helix domain-containing protein [Enterococcus casseliflavus]|uniref:helix-turn-helix domain-containing protein n=1 Tax=Enterococcus casseliflavus TaxID=37734 RepID=UPI002953DD12|nr:helix-turn-helix transcriptional regulator [Enterococcus casseliflavus]MDV7688751.1 helix-turn-helix transcriptional regulator [Enterococcus casseliflavus]
MENRNFIKKSNRAKEIRLKTGLTPSQVAHKATYATKKIFSESVIRNYENRKNVMDDDFRKALADFYGVSLRYMDGY